MSRDKAETIAYAIRKECQKYSLYDWCESWDITIDELERLCKEIDKQGKQVIDTYHIDTQFGLCKFAEVIKKNNIQSEIIEE